MSNKLAPCIYSPLLDCDTRDRKCEKCGWNPNVDKVRKENLKQKDIDKSAKEKLKFRKGVYKKCLTK